MSINKCRTCLNESSNLISVFSSRIVYKKTVKFSEMIESCMGINLAVKDETPKHICSKCENKIIKFFEFRLKTIEADDYFRNEWIHEFETDKCEEQIANIANLNYDSEESLISKTSPNKFNDNHYKHALDVDEIEMLDIFDDKSNTIEEIDTEFESVTLKFAGDPLENIDLDIDLKENSTQECKIENYDSEALDEKYYVSTTSNLKLPFMCEICGKMFRIESYALLHVRKIHKEIVSKTEVTNVDLEKTKNQFQDEFIASTMKQEIECIEINNSNLKYETEIDLNDVDDNIHESQSTDNENETVDFNDYDDDDLQNENRVNESVESENSHKSENDCRIRRYRKLPKIPQHELPVEVDNGLKCVICNKIFVNRNQAMNHLRRTHKGMKYKRKSKMIEKLCNICGATFNHPTNYYEHYKKHFPESCPKCSFCGKIFANKFQCTLHERCHTKEKPFQCEQCPYTCSQKSSLKTHMLTHSGLRPHNCDLCNKSYRSRYLLNEHILTYHNREKNHKCEICHKTFTRKWHLSKHAAVHSDDRPYECEYCNKSFKFRKNWKVHVMIHTGERPHVCGVCGQGFVQQSSLKAHIAKHSIENLQQISIVCKK